MKCSFCGKRIWPWQTFVDDQPLIRNPFAKFHFKCWQFLSDKLHEERLQRIKQYNEAAKKFDQDKWEKDYLTKGGEN